jgi:outer membrane protein assembly factor BamB
LNVGCAGGVAPRMRSPIAHIFGPCVTVLAPSSLAACALSLALAAHAQGPVRDPDLSIRALPAAPVDRTGLSGSAPVVRHASGDLVVAADGILRIGPEGELRWHVPDPEIVDVATSPDGAVIGLAPTPAARATSLRVERVTADGRRSWSRVLHRGRVDRYTYADVTAAPDGDVLVCSSVREGREVAVMIDRLGPTGNVVWTRRVASSGECHAVAADADAVYWTGQVQGARGGVLALERLDPSGAVVWSTRYEGGPLANELTISPGAITLGGQFIRTEDLLPGPGTHVENSNGYTGFVTRFDAATGAPRWAWASPGHVPLASVIVRGEDTIVVERGYATRLDSTGAPLETRTFGYPVRSDGQRSIPFVSVTGAVLDARGEIVLVGGLPEPIMLGGADLYLWSARPYHGVRGAVLGRPGW